MIDEELLVESRAQHASLLRDKTAALIDLSALVFNQPHLHDFISRQLAFQALAQL